MPLMRYKKYKICVKIKCGALKVIHILWDSSFFLFSSWLKCAWGFLVGKACQANALISLQLNKHLLRCDALKPSPCKFYASFICVIYFPLIDVLYKSVPWMKCCLCSHAQCSINGSTHWCRKHTLPSSYTKDKICFQ